MNFIRTTAVGGGATAVTGLGSAVKVPPPPRNWRMEMDVVIVGHGDGGDDWKDRNIPFLVPPVVR